MRFEYTKLTAASGLRRTISAHCRTPMFTGLTPMGPALIMYRSQSAASEVAARNLNVNHTTEPSE